MFCSKCGMQNEEGAKNCAGCGAPIDSENGDSVPIINPDPVPNENPQYGQYFTQQGAPKKRKTILYIAIVAIILIVAGSAIAILFNTVDFFKDAPKKSATNSEMNDDKKGFAVSDDLLDDTSWLSNDGSYIVFNDDETFEWYQKKEVTDNYYYSGTFEIFVGQEAVDYVTNDLSNYGITEDELEGVFDRAEEYELDIFICFVLNNESCMVNGENVLEAGAVLTPYYGFVLEDGTFLDVANMVTATYMSFEKE